ncbi:hypothetical protein Tco_1540265 [Tanacetum coccineum]
MPWAAEIGIRKRVKCYVQGSGRRKRKKEKLARLIEARVEETTHKEKATTEKEETIKEIAYTLTSLQSGVASLEAKGPVDEVRSKFTEFFKDNAEFSKDKESVEKVLSATKLPEGGNSHSAYSLYHLEGKVNFEGVENVTPWAADVGRRKIVKRYV